VSVHPDIKHPEWNALVTSERGKNYQVDVNTKTITQSDSRSCHRREPFVMCPTQSKRALTNGSVGKKYDLFPRMNPFYLEGDFNGDGALDVAVLIKERGTGKHGIAVVHGTIGKITILWAGIGIGNGGDDFDWMDSWQFTPKRMRPTAQVKPAFHISAATRFWLRRANPRAR